MAKAFHTLLAESLRKAKLIANDHIIQSASLSRIDRERLLKADSLQPIIKGWYLLSPPHTRPGESTAWYANYWNFIAQYLKHRFGDNYCLSAQSSMDLHLEKNYLSAQTMAVTSKGGSSILNLPHNTSLLIYQDKVAAKEYITQKAGINTLIFEYALCKLTDSFYRQQPKEAEIALHMLNAPEKILSFLLNDGMKAAAGRIIAALRHVNKNDIADNILQAMLAAGYEIKEINPFVTPAIMQEKDQTISPYRKRIEYLWFETREAILKLAPPPNNKLKNQQIMAEIDKRYPQDAYHSLSIEGYQVTEQLIQKIATGDWQPDQNETDKQQRNAMAAKGYFEAFQAVKATIKKMLTSNSPIQILQHDFPSWYLALFSPSVTAGIIKAENLAGFRNHPVYIRQARHVPPPYNAVRDCMDKLFTLLLVEEKPIVKAVLSHWFIGFIHPYMDGNGRMARFMMNAILVSHGYPWAIIHVENRERYLNALEDASINADITPFCKLIFHEMSMKMP